METTTISNIEIESHAITDRGLSEKRPENEDSFLESANIGLFAVADGVGGADAGEIASQMAIETLYQAFLNAETDADHLTVMASAFERANDAIFKMAQELPQLSRMATTIVAVKFAPSAVTFGHVGDSRIYRLAANGEMYRMTADHSLVGEEIRAGRLTEEQAENHPAKNVISRALGAESTVEPDLSVVSAEPGDVYLLCSDGITRHVSDAEIKGALSFYTTPDQACQYLKDLCFERGAEDNLTAIVVRVGGIAGLSETPAASLSVTALDPDDEPTVSFSRPFESDEDDDLLELGESSLPAEPVADELELFETVRYSPAETQPIKTEEPVLPEHETGPGFRNAETVEIPKQEPLSEPETVEPETVISTEPIREIAAPSFGSSYGSSIDTTESSGGGFTKILFAAACVAIGGLIGIAAYHYGFNSAAEPQPAPVVEMKSENIAFSSFEKNRRNVDADPAAFLKELPPPKDAEDHYLIARASILTGDVARAKASINEAATKLETSDPVNQKILKTEIATLQAILNDPNALKRFQTEIGKPAG